jgi:mannose-6-phosphate isomerase-like protein (cupin superfamily)
MRILEDGSTTGHRLGVGEIILPPHTDGPPQHRHARHDEGFYVVSGRASFTVGDTTYDAPAGTLVMVPPGAPHTFANPGDEATVLLNTFTPDLLHGGAGPQSVARFGQLLAEKGHHRVLTPTHPGFGGNAPPRRIGQCGHAGRPLRRLARRPRARRRDRRRELRRWLDRRRNGRGGHGAPQGPGAPRCGGHRREDHPLADVAGLSLPEIQALSFHDPTPFRVDPATVPDAQRAIMAANGAALAVYAGSTMADPTLLGRLSSIAIPIVVLWGESDQIVDPAYGEAYAAAIDGARFEVLAATGHMPQMETPDLVLQGMEETFRQPR